MHLSGWFLNFADSTPHRAICQISLIKNINIRPTWMMKQGGGDEYFGGQKKDYVYFAQAATLSAFYRRLLLVRAWRKDGKILHIIHTIYL